MKLTRGKALAVGIVTVAGTAIAASSLLSDSERDARGASSGGALAAGSREADSRAASAARRDVRAKTRGAIPGLSLGTGLLGSMREGSVSSLDGSGLASAGSLAARGKSQASGARAGANGPERVLSAEQKQKLAQALAKVDWDQSLKDLVQAIKAARTNGTTPDPDALVESAEINLALAEAAKDLGLKNPAAALGDPSVRSVVVPPWLNALGVNLDPEQAAAVASECLTVPPATPSTPGTFLDARQAAIQSRIALEQSLSSVLTSQQMATFATNVANDPLMKASAAQLSLTAGSTNGLTGVVATYWTGAFQLGGSSQQAVQAVASQYVASVMAVPPVAPNLDGEAARIAGLDRTNQLVALQQQAEQTLASSAGLTPAEQSRAANGSNRCLRLGVSK